MPSIILWVAFFTFIIHYIDTLSYSVRIAGVRTGHIALATALFNILFLASRMANGVQAPLLTKYVERAILSQQFTSLNPNFRFIIFSATLASIAAAVSTPTFHRLMALAIMRFKETQSVLKLILSTLSTQRLAGMGSSFKLPSADSLKGIYNIEGLPFWTIFSNFLVTAIHTIGVLSAIYAGVMIPAYRGTAITLSLLVNGGATILYFIFVNPVVAFMTDQTLAGEIGQGRLRRLIVFLVAGKTAGTLLGQLLFVPAAIFISFIARII